MILRGAISLRGALEGVGPENQDFFGPWNGTSEVATFKIITYRAIKTTGTLIVIKSAYFVCYK